MPGNTWITSGGTNYYLSGTVKSGTPYTGSGTPWTAQATTPYSISLNESTPVWTPTAAPAVPITQGGPPLNGYSGSRLLDRGFDSVQEPIGIQCYANSHDNAVTLLQQLRKVLNPVSGQPAILAVQPNGSTAIAYYHILYADVQETPSLINEEANNSVKVVRCTVTWLRTPFASALSAGESALGSGTSGNTGTGGTNNVRALTGSLSGEFANEGQPMNTRFTLASGTAANVIFLGTIYGRSYATTGAGAYSGASGSVVLGHFDASAFIGRPLLKPRFMVRCSGVSDAILSIRVYPSDGTTNGLRTIYTSKTQTVTTTGPFTSISPYTVIYDFGTWPMDFYTAGLVGSVTPYVYVILDYASPVGFSLTYSEFISYYTWCKIETPDAAGSTGIISTTIRLDVESFVAQTNYPAQPLPAPRALGTVVSTSTPYTQFLMRGEAPRYYAGASLYTAWQAHNGHSTSATATTLATQSALWSTLRGAD